MREDYGHLNLDIVVEDTLVRVAGSTTKAANWIGIVDVPDGRYRMEHGLVVTEDTRESPPQEHAVTLVAVNGLEQRLKAQRLQQEVRKIIEAELKAFRAQVGNGVTVKPVTYRNPQSLQDEPGAEVFLEGTTEPLGWITSEHLPRITGELKGVLVSGTAFTLNVLCPLDTASHSSPLGVEVVPTKYFPEEAPAVDDCPPRNRQGMSLGVVDGWQYKINRGIATQGELNHWKAKAGSPATIRLTTFVRAGVTEPAVAVYLDGQAKQFGWIVKEQIPAVKQELHGYLARNGQYTLTFICDQPK